MSQAKQASKRKRTRKAVPVAGLGLAGLSLSLVGGATTAIGGPAANMPTQANAPSHEITLGEEEISDVSLGTFYVFDKENLAPRPGVQLAAGHGCGGHGCAHGGGARGCGGGHGCGGRGCGGRGCGGRGCGLGGCGCWGGCGCGCCLSWGGCAIC
jgi:hypothetical protein